MLNVKLLCAADIHLGRQPSRLPEALPMQPSDLGPAAAWWRLVEAAVDEGVDAVLIAGDVVDREDDFFEAYADLRDGVARLAEAGIEVVAVAGNHDTRVLPRLADALADGPGSFTLLGRDGVWEGMSLGGAGGERVEVVGWSFPKPTTTTDPLASGPPARAGGGVRPVARIGLLHCDRDQTGSAYAPVRSSELDAAPVDAWLLGHVHRPDIAAGDRPIGYLGSLVGTDPGEPGAHGAWLLEVDADGRLSLALVPLAPLRWESRSVALDGLEEGAEVAVRIAEALDALDREIDGDAVRPLAVGCRLRLTGRTRHRAGVSEALRRDDPTAAQPSLRRGTSYFIDTVTMDASPEYDLDALATERSPAGALAQRLRLLDGLGDPDERRALVERARRRLAEVVAGAPLAAADSVPPDEERTVALLRRAGYEALDSLLAQRGEGS